MNYLSDKVNSFTGDAISGVNEMRRKWKQTRGRSRTSTSSDEQQQQGQATSAINNDEQGNTQHGQTRVAPPPLGMTTTPRGQTHYYASTMTTGRSPLAASTPFGGDHSFTSGPAPPPIGFNLPPPPAAISHGPQQAGGVTTQEPTLVKVQDQEPGEQPQRPPRAKEQQLRPGDSSESLYEADAWARLWFPRVMILCLLRMLLFIRKLYEDFHATKVYNITGQTGFLMISALTLLLPTLMFTLYRVSRYLQLVLPDLRLAKATVQRRQSLLSSTSTGAANREEEKKKREDVRGSGGGDDDEAQLTRALMTSSPESVASAVGKRAATPTSGEEGLVTARQSPIGGASSEVEFHDSQQEPQVPKMSPVTGAEPSVEISLEPSTSSARVAASPAKLESVNVDKLGDLPDKDTVRIVVGASEQFLHGILFVFWQLKRQVDVMGYLVERACLWRKPAEREKEELARLRTGSDGLEWFQDFYAAFLAILAQVYMLTNYLSTASNRPPLRSTQSLSAYAAVGVPPPPGTPAAPSTSVVDSARVISSLFGTQTLGSEGDVLLLSELVISSAVILSLMLCVRRRDDGPLTLGLSMLGWGSLFAGRIIAIGLAFVHLGWRVVTPLIVLHVLIITGWIYSIALASHNDSPSERSDEAEWDPEVGAATATADGDDETGGGGELELKENMSSPGKVVAQQQQQQQSAGPLETSTWSLGEHLALLSQIITLFAIPSLFYWPIMFNLKLHLRPFKYLVLILIQNFLLIPAVWYAISSGHNQVGGGDGAAAQPTPGQLYLLGAVGACSVVGFIFVSLYVACKPSLTEYFARADELFNEADQSGIYYEFCSRVFKMADLSKHKFRRLMDQSEELVEERYELVTRETVSQSAS